jgi:hypothetical protein
MNRSRIGGTLDMEALATLTRQAETEHRPTDPATLRREAEHLLAIGLSVQDAAQALNLLPGALAQLLNPETLQRLVQQATAGLHSDDEGARASIGEGSE